MAANRSLPRTQNSVSFLSCSVSASASVSTAPSRSSFPLIHRLRPFAGAVPAAGRCFYPSMTFRCFTTDTASSPISSNQPTKEAWKLPQGCDFKHCHRSLPRTQNLASFLSCYISASASLSTAPSRSSFSQAVDEGEKGARKSRGEGS